MAIHAAGPLRIQVDMFAVELGAAMLLQFESDGSIVRVLAHGGKARYDVNAKLPQAIQNFGGHDLKIDLMIGTHYDADHLDGLVEIIEDSAVSIGEAWLPPVANDTEPHSLQDIPDDQNLLPLQFRGEGGYQVLFDYIMVKADICTRLARAEQEADEIRGLRREREYQRSFTRGDIEGHLRAGWHTDRLGDFFRGQVADAERTIGTSIASHGDEQILDPWIEEFVIGSVASWNLEDSAAPVLGWNPADVDALAKSWRLGRGDRAATEAASLARIRRSSAKDAINARSLNRVVKALKDNGIPMRCSTILDGNRAVSTGHSVRTVFHRFE